MNMIRAVAKQGTKEIKKIKGIKKAKRFISFSLSSLSPLLSFSLSLLFFCFLSFPFAVSQSFASECKGEFVNPVTDICWECMFPISIGDVELGGGDMPDTENPSNPICRCPAPPPIFTRIGITSGFWEPIRLVDVTKKPFCFVNLGGMEIDLGFELGHGQSPHGRGKSDTSSWHVHWYIYPAIYWMELIADFGCVEPGSFDIAYITEIDPLWQDDILTFILNPEAILFSNPIAQAACAADCIKSTVSTPFDLLFWCAGCQGSMYPLNGRVSAHIGGVQSSLLAVQKMAYKLHRELLAWGTSGTTSAQLCSSYPMPIMKKSQYRTQLVNPVPSDCYPFGRTTTIYESGKEVPVQGEDFGYLIWRKKNCCVL